MQFLSIPNNNHNLLMRPGGCTQPQTSNVYRPTPLINGSLTFATNIVTVPAPSVTNPDERLRISKLYVIRRKLSGYPKIGSLSHSGLLLQASLPREFYEKHRITPWEISSLSSQSCDWYILEYGVGSGQERNNVYLYKLPQGVISIANSCRFTSEDAQNNRQTWDKQKLGTPIYSVQTTESIKSVMDRIVTQNKYAVLTWNCHMAQENTRRSLGLKVTNPYKAPSGNVGITLSL